MLATAAPSFFILVVSATPAAAQRMELGGRAGVVFSSALVEDGIATAPARQLLGGGVDSLVRVVPGAGVSAGIVARFGFWPRASLDVSLDWTRSELRAEEDGETRDVQPLDVVAAAVGASWSVRQFLEVGGAVGLLRYITEERGIFAAGSDASPVLEARASLIPPILARRAALSLHVQTHRFGTQALRDRGGVDGSVTRFGAGLRVRLAEVTR